MSGPNGSLSSSSTETLKSSPPHSQDAKLTNGVSESQAIESSVDEPPLTDPLPETDSSDNTPDGSPLTKDKVDRQQSSHERQDSASSYGVATTESDLSEASSNNRVIKAGSGDVDVSTEVAVAYSPDGRFLKYDIEIGRGSFKTVYKGLDTETGVAIAWCELQEKRYNKAEQARFKEEVAILKTLQHPNILKLYDSWGSTGHRAEKKDKVKDKVLVLVTELMTSGTLKSYMRRLKSIKPKVIRSWGRQILKGLHFLHTRMPPIIHRDLKCDNIFINGTTGLVKIGDLGLATLKRNDVSTVIGTPEFMAPEMYEESYDESVDVYAFGMCLLEMCTQEYPYMECSNPAQIYKRVTQGIKPHAIDKVKDAALRDIIEKCTTPNKFNRLTVSALLNHEYFCENIKIDVVPASEDGQSLVTMRMDVPNQDSSKKNGQESIEFTYDLTKDVPENVVRDMVKSGILSSSVQQMVSRSLREYVETVKQKQGRNKTEANALNPEGKLAEMRSENLSHTPSPSPALTVESSLDSEPSTVPILRQASTSDSSKPEESSSSKESSQGPDMTGQGAIPQPVERDRSLSFNASKVEPKTSEVSSPVNSTGQTLPEPTPSTSQQITASTGQALPPIAPPKEPNTKPQAATSAPVVKPPSAVVKETVTADKVPANPPTVPVEVSQDRVATEQVVTAVQEMHVSESTPETVPIQQSSHGEPEAPGTGSLKRKSQRLKGKGIKVSFIERISDNKIVCQLATSNNKINYQFSIKYDKPEEMFRKFVEKQFLTVQDKDEFIQQSKALIQNAKKAKDSAPDSKVSSQDPHLKSRSSTEPALSPPNEPTTESSNNIVSEPSSQTDTRTRVYSSSNFSPKLESHREHYPRTESVSTQESIISSEVLTKESPLNSVPTSNGSKQPPDSVSSLVTHAVTSVEAPRPSSPKITVSNPLIMPATNDPLSSNSLPLLNANVPVSLPNSHSSPQYPSTGNLIVQQTRIFEVENVAEDKPDSPEMSDLSNNGSTDNLGREAQRSDSQESNPARRFMVQSVSSLESKSDSYIGKEPVPGELSPAKQPPLATQQAQLPNKDHDSKSLRHNSVPYVLPSSMTRPSANVGSRSASIPEHYSTTSLLDSAASWQRGGITEDTYINPSHKYYTNAHTIHSSGYHSYPPSEAEVPLDPADTHPASDHQHFNMDELPQAALLSEAFMRFMHSMSLVFRDPTFQPLMNTLDKRFGLQEPVSSRPVRQESRSNTEPTSTSGIVGQEVEFRSAIEEIEEEQRKLERRKQDLIEDFKKRKGSSGNSSVESSTDSRKISTVSYESSITQSPTQARRQAKLDEYEEASNGETGNRANTHAMSEMEKRVRDEIISDRLMSTHQYDIHPPLRGRSSLHQTLSNPNHLNQAALNQGLLKQAHGSSSQFPPNASVNQHQPMAPNQGPTGQAHPNQGSMIQRHSNQASITQGQLLSGSGLHHGQIPSRTVSGAEYGGSVSPALQTSPPPTHTLGQSTFLMHSPGGTARLAHSDSSEWTEYTSAPVSTANTETSPRVPLRTQSKADVSEFDPITTHANNGQFSRPKS